MFTTFWVLAVIFWIVGLTVWNVMYPSHSGETNDE